MFLKYFKSVIYKIIIYNKIMCISEYFCWVSFSEIFKYFLYVFTKKTLVAFEYTQTFSSTNQVNYSHITARIERIDITIKAAITNVTTRKFS